MNNRVTCKRSPDSNDLERQGRCAHNGKCHRQPTEDNFCNKHGKIQELVTIADYLWHMGYNDKSDRMANRHPLSWMAWKWPKIIFSFLGPKSTD
jgi:hypothetical protein